MHQKIQKYSGALCVMGLEKCSIVDTVLKCICADYNDLLCNYFGDIKPCVSCYVQSKDTFDSKSSDFVGLLNQAKRNSRAACDCLSPTFPSFLSHLCNFFSLSASPSPSVRLSLSLLSQAPRIKTPEKACLTTARRKRCERNLFKRC